MSYEPLLHVVLYQPEIPHNTGAVGRTCVAVGAKLWLVRPLGFRVDDYYLRRAGLDYWEHLEWEVVDDWPALCARLQCEPSGANQRPSQQAPQQTTGLGPPREAQRQPPLLPRGWLFTKSAARPYTAAQYQPGDALVFGAETAGLPPALVEAHAQQALRIPIRAQVRSLNLSNAVAVACFEAQRQWSAGAQH